MNNQCTTYFNCTCTDCTEYRARLAEFRAKYNDTVVANLQHSQQQTQETPTMGMTTDAELESLSTRIKEQNMQDTLGTLVEQLVELVANKVINEVVDKIQESIKDSIMEDIAEELKDDMQSIAEDVCADTIGNTQLNEFYNYEETIREVVAGCNWQLTEA